MIVLNQWQAKEERRKVVEKFLFPDLHDLLESLFIKALCRKMKRKLCDSDALIPVLFGQNVSCA